MAIHARTEAVLGSDNDNSW